MFYNPLDFPFLARIIDNKQAIINEFTAKIKSDLLHNFLQDEVPILHSHTEYWIKEGGFDSETIGYDSRIGTFGSFPLFKKGFPIKWCDIESEFPVMLSHIKSVPKVNFSALSRLGINSGLDEHVHCNKNLIFHLCLTDVQGISILRCNGKERVLSRPGDYALFDYSLPHSSFNYGKSDRINLAIDFSR